MKVFLDDIRTPPEKGVWITVRNAETAQKFCRVFGCPSVISFDHDLGEDKLTGFDFAKWLVERDLDHAGAFIPKDFDFKIHSANPVGAANIEGLLRPYLAQRGENNRV